MNVLIAEDETIIRLDLRALLERYGFVVCAEARDGMEAVELARTTLPDAAILDLRMPSLDGIEAARRIYAERPIPIVMLTAFSDRSYVDRAIAAGVFAYLVKPFRESDIVPALRAATVRHEELLAARRTIGAEPLTTITIRLPSQNGHTWPLRLHQGDDGSVEVKLDQRS
jgi:DNA-binding NarL/FixJ family response regulator